MMIGIGCGSGCGLFEENIPLFYLGMRKTMKKVP
jgi:hypothetical protein